MTALHGLEFKQQRCVALQLQRQAPALPALLLHKQLQRHRGTIQQLQSSWGSSSSSNPGNNDAGVSRFAGFFSGSSSSSSGSSRGDSSNGGDGSSSRFFAPAAAAAADSPPRWVLVALVPTVIWCITWSLTGGLVSLANCSMAGMVSLARLLFPSLPLRGLEYEDVAVSLVKGLQGGTDMPGTWTRPGLWLPAWLLRGLMGAMFSLAAGSSAVAAALIPVPQVVLLSGLCKGLMYTSCLLLMLPLGAGLNSLLERSVRGRPIKLPRLSDNTLLTLKLAGMLAWPCISASAVLRPSLLAAAAAQKAAAAAAVPSAAGAATAAAAAASSSAAGAFAGATLQVFVCCLLLVLLLAVAAVAGRFCWLVARQQAPPEAVFVFGLQVGLLAALQGGANLVQICLGLASRALPLSDLVMPLVSTLVLSRIAWSVWRLHRIGANAPSLWLQVLNLTPALPAGGSGGTRDGSGGRDAPGAGG